jgi:hypothetical protein
MARGCCAISIQLLPLLDSAFDLGYDSRGAAKDFVFPHSNDPPSTVTKFSLDSTITSHIRADFFLPKLHVGRRV